MFVNSQVLFTRAQQLIPGGVNSPARSFSLVKHVPPFVKKARGAELWDEDGNKYLDFVGSWGAAILGHAHPEVVEEVSKSLADGLSFGAPTKKENYLADLLLEAFPSADKVRLLSSGTEACMTAVRIARGYTKRSKIIKFTGHYHGHSDALLAQAGSGVASLALSEGQGIPAAVTADTLSVPFQDIKSLRSVFSKYSNDIAAVIFEPITGNCGMIKPDPQFLQELVLLCKKNSSLLICDEVMTGFRVSWGGAQNIYDLDPDLTTLGKIVGGGMPLAAVIGKKEVMDVLAPKGEVYQAGTLSGNPIAVTCGIATLTRLKQKGIYEDLEKKSLKIATALKQIGFDNDISLQTTNCGGMFGYFFNSNVVANYESAKTSNMDLFINFFKKMLSKNIYLPPSPYEACFISCAHSEDNVNDFLQKATDVLRTL
jgi:glutamate-1-semialdehyde 2,1-aminomutase